MSSAIPMITPHRLSLVQNQRVLSAEEDFGGPVAPKLSAKNAADNNVVVWPCLAVSRNVATASFALDHIDIPVADSKARKAAHCNRAPKRRALVYPPQEERRNVESKLLMVKALRVVGRAACA